MGTRCEHMAVFYMPLGTPWNPLVPVAIAYSCFNYQPPAHRRANLACWNSCYVMRTGKEFNTRKIRVTVPDRCLLSLRRTVLHLSERTWRNIR